MMKEPPDLVHTAFSAVLLAGGKSTRMGFDKATLEIGGQALWQRQIQLLQSLYPTEIFISGPINGPWQGSGPPVIEDEIAGLGPLGAIVGVLKKIRTPRILVLAVDMPCMSATFLQRLLAFSSAVVPWNGDYYEPLAAVYDLRQRPAMEISLQTGRLGLQNFLHQAVRAVEMQVLQISEAEKGLFHNLNSLENRISPVAPY